MSRAIAEADGVFAFQLYEPERCQSIVEHLKALDAWLTAQVVVPDAAGSPVHVLMPEARTASILSPEAGRALFAEFEGKLREVVTPLIKDLWRADITRYDGTQIVRYGVGGHYGTHADAGPTMSQRFFTILCYLNDDFEDGQTWFPSLGYTTTPRRGKAVLFPARYMHRAVPVASGEKYVLASWGVGPTPINWI